MPTPKNPKPSDLFILLGVNRFKFINARYDSIECLEDTLSHLKLISINSWSYSHPRKGCFWLGVDKREIFGKRFQLSLFCLPSEPLVVRKHERLLGRQWLLIWALCVGKYIAFCYVRAGQAMRLSFRRVLLFVLNCLLESSFCYWLQVSSISPRWLFSSRLKFQIKLNLDFKLSNLFFWFDFCFESLWFYGWSILLTISRWNFVLRCCFFMGNFFKGLTIKGHIFIVLN